MIYAFEHIFSPPETCPLKRYFLTSGGVKKRILMHLPILPDQQNLFFEKDIFYRLEWLKTCFYVFSHTSWPPETFFQRDVFHRLEWLKTWFDAFAHTSRPPKTFFQKIHFLPSGVVKNFDACFDAFAYTSRPPETVTLWSG